MTTLVTMRKVEKGRGSAHRALRLECVSYIGRAVIRNDRVIVMNRDGNILFDGSRDLWKRLISLGLAAGGPSPLPAGEPPPAQR